MLLLHVIRTCIVISTLFLASNSYKHLGSVRVCKKSCRLQGLPTETKFQFTDVEFLRAIGKLDISADDNLIREAKQELTRLELPQLASLLQVKENGRAVTCRVYEARLAGGPRCIVKEFLPMGLPFGRREFTNMRKLTASWNKAMLLDDPVDSLAIADRRLLKMTQENIDPPFPILLGYVRPNENVASQEYQKEWSRRFPRLLPPIPYTLWLVYLYDSATLKAFRTFPYVPQVVEGLDIFKPDQREDKRWRFVRRLLRCALGGVGFLHASGLCHNALSADTLWMSTMNQPEIDSLSVKVLDLSAAQTADDLGAEGLREGVVEDIYSLGLVFLELVLTSFSEDTSGAEEARRKLKPKDESVSIWDSLVSRFVESDDGTERVLGFGLNPRGKKVLRHLTQQELKEIFEDLCGSDFERLLSFCRSIGSWKGAVRVLERDGGAGWKLIFTMLAKGRLYDNSRNPISLTCGKLIKDFPELFKDTYS